jgi:hypothetical protein
MNMQSFWTRQRHAVRFGLVLALLAACVIYVPVGLAHHQTGQNTQNPTVDDVLDDPTHYEGEVVTLEGEVDRVYKSSLFFMEDDQDLFGEDQILILSVMPDEVRVDGELSEGKLVRATGTVRMMNRSQLEQEFGPLDWSGIDAQRLSKLEADQEPVLIMGATEFAARRVRQEEAAAAPVVPEPPAPPEIAPVEPPETIVEPEPQPAPEPVEPGISTQEPVDQPAAQDETLGRDTQGLPATATPLPLVALTGLLSLMTGLGIRFFR